MAHLPVIVGFGGVNPAGRSSFHHGYRRLVIDALSQDKAQLTLNSLMPLMDLHGEANDPIVRQAILNGTLIRQMEPELLDANAIEFHKNITVHA